MKNAESPALVTHALRELSVELATVGAFVISSSSTHISFQGGSLPKSRGALISAGSLTVAPIGGVIQSVAKVSWSNFFVFFAIALASIPALWFADGPVLIPIAAVLLLVVYKQLLTFQAATWVSNTFHELLEQASNELSGPNQALHRKSATPPPVS